MKESRLFLSETEVENANINRSPTAYKNNPEFERAQWVDFNINKNVEILKNPFTDTKTTLIKSWFS